MKKIQISLLAIIVLVLQGCYQDKGNYTYVDINEVSISFKFGGKDTAVGARGPQLLLGDSLIVYATITSTLKSEGFNPDEGYLYEWAAVAQGTGRTATVLGRQKDLSIRMELGGGNYDVYLTVTDPETELVVRNKFPLMVTSVTGMGWIILSDVDGKAKMSMMAKAGNKLIPTSDILAVGLSSILNSPESVGLDEDSLRALWTFPYEEMGAPIKMVHSGMNDQLSPGAATFYVLCKGGTTRIHRHSFVWNDSYRLRRHFIDESYCPSDLIAQDMYHAGGTGGATAIFVGNNNNVYYMNPSGAIYFAQPYNTLDGGVTTFKASTVIGGISEPSEGHGCYVIFNEDDRTFYKVEGNARVCEPIDETKLPALKLSYKNIPPEYELKRVLYNQWPSSATDYLYFLFKHTGTGKMHILRTTANTLAQEDWHEINGAPGIERATVFIAGGPNEEDIYYAVDDEVYVYNIPEDKSHMALSKPGHEITTMNFINPFGAGGSVRAEDICVAFYNGSPGGGSFGQYRITNASTNFELCTYDFGDKIYHTGYERIVDITWK